MKAITDGTMSRVPKSFRAIRILMGRVFPVINAWTSAGLGLVSYVSKTLLTTRIRSQVRHLINPQNHSARVETVGSITYAPTTVGNSSNVMGVVWGKNPSRRWSNRKPAKHWLCQFLVRYKRRLGRSCGLYLWRWKWVRVRRLYNPIMLTMCKHFTTWPGGTIRFSTP